jgi:hypothetical protein
MLFIAGPNFLQKNVIATSKATKLTTKCVVRFDHPSTILIEVPIFLSRLLINIAQKNNSSCAF